MDFLTSLINQAESPLWITFLLGLVFALDPCAILTNIASIGYLGRDITTPKRVFRNGLWYTLGRTLAFGLLGGILMWLLHSGAEILHVQDFFAEYGELLLIPFLIIMGALMFVADLFPSFKWSLIPDSVEQRMKQSAWGSFLLGAILSLAFCPTNAMIFFGMLVPLGAHAEAGWLLLLVFALTVALPVILISWILAFSLESISRFYASIQKVGNYFRWAVGAFFILLGLFFLFEHLLE
ncbi:MAG TPA: aromatic aminobenezylarsenical efflux permease ArsG family transporter [Paludibacteraceae bacterium]|nr:aromatic aminobenezylarsenical efflux permease ArsG family transporter [Paludibacteraceae bacterium]